MFFKRTLVIPGVPRNLVAGGEIPDSFVMIKTGGKMKVFTQNGRLVFTATKVGKTFYELDYDSLSTVPPTDEAVAHSSTFMTEDVAMQSYATEVSGGDPEDPLWKEIREILRYNARTLRRERESSHSKGHDAAEPDNGLSDLNHHPVDVRCLC